ncbi:hypothetical protein GCK72_017198 [Caenorhabditis remanei]|uniref:Transmembrane protein 231 n=1 Tax=Caenorhabditis remanei TaxID=31234 RepID=A0A6A5G6N2_CAERE|nr:hypothetical protein GCK72_017198 [Caenorhabditis remanei]KAF1750647.1 hypothetical protein GCK72_017198 [Caenorhabditis remanei]
MFRLINFSLLLLVVSWVNSEELAVGNDTEEDLEFSTAVNTLAVWPYVKTIIRWSGVPVVLLIFAYGIYDTIRRIRSVRSRRDIRYQRVLEYEYNLRDDRNETQEDADLISNEDYDSITFVELYEGPDGKKTERVGIRFKLTYKGYVLEKWISFKKFLSTQQTFIWFFVTCLIISYVVPFVRRIILKELSDEEYNRLRDQCLNRRRLLGFEIEHFMRNEFRLLPVARWRRRG